MEQRSRILLVEEDNSLRSSLGMFLEKNGCEVAECKNSGEAMELLDKGIYDLVVSEHRLSDKDGLWLLKRVRKEFPETRFILMSAYAGIDVAVQAMKDGASDFLSKPFTPPFFIDRCNLALDAPAKSTETKAVSAGEIFSLNEFVGRSYTVKRAKDLIRMASSLPKSILITGETGVGKEAIARQIHLANGQEGSPFVRVSCEANDEVELEQDLFAADGGLLLAADGGTIFLDEVGSLPPRLQAKLLDVLESGKFRVRGTLDESPLTVRFICSSRVSLGDLVESGDFKSELFHRINMVHIELEPLCERVDDIPVLLGYFLRGFNAANGKKIKGFTRTAYELLNNYMWPGNVRELRNVIERCVLYCNDEYIQEQNVPESVRNPKPRDLAGAGFSGVMTLRDMERMKILETLRSFGGNRATTAKALGIGRNTLWRKLKEYEIEE